MTAATDTPPRAPWLLLIAGPVIWFVHFMLVYLVVEAGCAAGGFDTEVLGLPVLAAATLAATAVAGGATLALARAAHRRWRAGRDSDGDWLAGDDRNPSLALAGALLGILFTVSILFVGVPAAFLEPC